MARILSSKCKLCRREGHKLFLKGKRCYSPKCPMERRKALPPGQHGHKRFRRLSVYGQQLREKQKMKRFYSVLERQFKRYYRLASLKSGNIGENMLLMLERRLDNCVYRLGFAPSRSVARQLVVHGNILVDGKKVDRPSYLLTVGQVVSMSARGLKIPIVKENLADEQISIPAWFKRKAAVGKLIRLPEREELQDVPVSEELIVEYYSR